MNIFTIFHLLGVLLLIFSLSLLPPLFVSWLYQDGIFIPFLTSFVLVIAIGFIFWLVSFNRRRTMSANDGFIIVSMFWIALSIIGALPFMLSKTPHMNLTDALFESVSGLTTTGATVLVGLDSLPKSILYYRQQLQWLGGMGIIVLAVAVLPMLGIGGVQLFKNEIAGPVKNTKLHPKIAETAKALWRIYAGLTLICALCYWLAGMDGFDALCHAFSTIAIGGFSTHDASMGYFNSSLIEIIACFFMLIAGMNFALHFGAFKSRTLRHYLQNAELRLYLFILAFVSILIVINLLQNKTFESFDRTLIQGIFHTISIGTTTGFTTTDFYNWSGFAAILLLFTSFIGGCAGSTGGGIKVVRFMLLIKQGIREINQLIHPDACYQIRIGKQIISPKIINTVWGFFALYVASYILMYLALAATGLDLITAFSAVGASINNLGPGLGEVGLNYANINDTAKWILSFGMLLGRLEIFTLLVILSPEFWHR